MMMRKNGGFTIVELLIVIVVIAILAAITVVSYTGVISRTYMAKASAGSAALTRATEMYYLDNSYYPADVSRNIPSEITKYINASTNNNWPTGPWPDSVYDYDYFIGSDGNEVVQYSIRFCPIGGPLSACHFPNEPWAADFNVNSSAYWCIKGMCRAHPNESDSYPGYCLNCNER